MPNRITNLVFEGGGILGIAYLGVLDYLNKNNLLKNIKRIAGASAGAITACLTSFNLPFEELKALADTLEYKKVPEKGNDDLLRFIPEEIKKTIEGLFGDINCLYRLLKRYGWYSSEFFYNWIRDAINDQFDASKKKPPYTFADFRNPSIHKQERTFSDLFIIGTNISTGTTRVFSFETTPLVEVARAVRISMSIPLYFESIEQIEPDSPGFGQNSYFSDGGVMDNYPINIFDTSLYGQELYRGVNRNTMGACFVSDIKFKKINNLVEFAEALVHTLLRVQEDAFHRNPLDKARSIMINTGEISATNFDVSLNDSTYQFLYNQGYEAAKDYFQKSKGL